MGRKPMVDFPDDVYEPCPDTLLPLAAAAADIDAKAIFRLIWHHIGEARMAGIPPFGLEEVAG
jgi:hypothetical protein